ncbi:MAG: ATP-binding cassette domain-containing protein, partial [Deinococcus sp.]|nr:ATP-binding cassette domain-containing protein [Deinococcus sp.]
MHIIVEQVVKGYAGRVVLQVEHLTIGAGELLGIIGPSAAGKSTLLRLLAMLEQPDQGILRWDGSSDWSLARRRQVTLLLPSPQLF